MGKSCRHKFSLCANCIANQVSPITLVRSARRVRIDALTRAPSLDVRDFSFFLFLTMHGIFFFNLFVRSFVHTYVLCSFVRWLVVLAARNLSLHFSLAFGHRAQRILIPLKMLSVRFFSIRLIPIFFYFSLSLFLLISL